MGFVPASPSGLPRFVLGLALLGVWTLMADPASPLIGPRIDRIELLDPDLVTVHFDTEADRGYDLEFMDVKIQSGADPKISWKLLFSVPAIPFANHYVIADARVPGARIYRLKVTP